MTTQEAPRTPQPASLDLRGFTFSPQATLIRPGDADYDAARHVWNGRADRHPALIVRCATTDDVVSAIRLARQHGLPLAVRGGGHSVAGFGTCDGGVVIDLAPMAAVNVDAARRRARAGGGTTWGRFDQATGAAGLGTTGAMISTVGVGGLTLGGGFGMLMRKYGLAADNLRAAQVVTADGAVVTASETEHADLLWGLRGGGGNFGVVTAFEFDLHPISTVLGGMVLHPAAHAGALLRFYRDFVATTPDELTTMVFFLTAPPAPFVPESLHGRPAVAILACYAGTGAEAEAAVAPLRTACDPAADLLQPLPYPALQSMLDSAAPAGLQNDWKAAYLPALSDAAIAVLVERASAMASPLSSVHIHHLGGAVARVPEQATAFAHRGAAFALNILPAWTNPAESTAHVGWAYALWQAMQPYAAEGVYSNFLGDEGPARVRAAYGANYARLAALKQQYDPENIFRGNQNIPPQAE